MQWGVVSLFLLGLACLPVWSGNEENQVFSKRRDLPLLESASPSAKAVAKAAWNEPLKVLEKQNRWIKVSGQDGEGWVYGGNVSTEKLPEENRNNVAIKSSEMSAGAAGRGLSDGASAYASRHSLKEVAEQIEWAEKLNASITAEAARNYLKEHQLGEFAGTK